MLLRKTLGRRTLAEPLQTQTSSGWETGLRLVALREPRTPGPHLKINTLPHPQSLRFLSLSPRLSPSSILLSETALRFTKPICQAVNRLGANRNAARSRGGKIRRRCCMHVASLPPVFYGAAMSVLADLCSLEAAVD